MIKGVVLAVIATLLLVNANLLVGGESSSFSETFSKEVSSVVESAVGEDLSAEELESVKPYVENFVEKRGIEPEKVKEIKKVDFEKLPKEVNIENVNDANLAIYEVEYEEKPSEIKKVFVISYSVEKLRAQGDLIVAHDKRMFLNFGFAGKGSGDAFLKTATGVEGSTKKGYVMMRHGSITGLSSSLVIREPGRGNIDIVIYKNGKEVGFRNSLNTEKAGIHKDYDIQSKGVVSFEPGDIISVKLELEPGSEKGIIWEDAVTLLEITTEE